MTKSQAKSKAKVQKKSTIAESENSTPSVSVLLGTTVKKEQAEQVALMQTIIGSQPVAMIVQVIPKSGQVTVTLIPPVTDPDQGFEVGSALLQDALRVWTEQGLLARQVREQYARDTVTTEEKT